MPEEEILTNDLPFIFESKDKRRVIVKFAKVVDHDRNLSFADDLKKLVRRYTFIACDLTKTEIIISDWLRFLCKLTIEAKNSGKVLAIVGMKPNLKKSSDVIGLSTCFRFFDNLKKVWDA